MRAALLFLLFCIARNEICNAQGGIWTWIRGDTAVGAGNYGTMGVAAPTNDPPIKYQGAHCTDRFNNLWIFGGSSMNDLWKYNIATNMWTWMKGPQYQNNMMPVYGTQGVPSATNNPAATFTEGMLLCDTFNNLWLISGVDNILWKYDMATNNWIWMKGNPGNVAAVYGIQGVPNVNNTPTTIVESKTSWVDKNDNLWFMDNNNCMWRFSIATNMWTWMKGDSTGQTYSYGTKGVDATSNQPPMSNMFGSSFIHTSWKDKFDNFYIYDHDRGTVWRFSITTNNWTWVAGDTTNGTMAVYGPKCVASATITPGGRFEERGTSNILCGDVFWLYGGTNNDIWQFNPNTMLWTWAGGDSVLAPTSYGVKGVPSTSNQPATMLGHSLWTDNNNNLWAFNSEYGGSQGNVLWRYVPDIACVPNSAGSNNFTFTLPSDTILCAGDTCVMLLPDSVAFTISSNNTNFNFNSDSSILYFYPTANASYTISGTKGSACTFSDSVVVNISNKVTTPLIHNPMDSVMCNGDTLSLAIPNAYSISIQPNSYIQTNSDTTTLFFYPISNTVYTLYTLDSGSCAVRDTTYYPIYVTPTPVVDFSVNPQSATIYKPEFQYTNLSTGAVNYKWYYNNSLFSTDINTSKTFSDSGLYCITLVACNFLGCCDSATHCNRIDDAYIIVPNVFSPNDDGRNDFLKIIYKNVTLDKFTIYNRWGEQVFTTDDINTAWDGYFKEWRAEIGTYFYVVEYRKNGEPALMKGDVTIVR